MLCIGKPYEYRINAYVKRCINISLGFTYTAEGLVSSGLIKDGYDKDTVANVFEGGVLPKFTSTYACRRGNICRPIPR